MFVKRYALGSWIIGLLQICGGICLLIKPGIIAGLLVRTEDYPATSAFFVEHVLDLCANVELLWVPVSLLAILLFKRDKKPLLSPISFILCSVLKTLIWSAFPILLIMPAGVMPSTFDWLKQSVSPIFLESYTFAIIGISFGLFYLTTNVKLYRKLNAESSL